MRNDDRLRRCKIHGRATRARARRGRPTTTVSGVVTSKAARRQNSGHARQHCDQNRLKAKSHHPGIRVCGFRWSIEWTSASNFSLHSVYIVRPRHDLKHTDMDARARRNVLDLRFRSERNFGIEQARQRRPSSPVGGKQKEREGAVVHHLPPVANFLQACCRCGSCRPTGCCSWTYASSP